VSDPVDIPRERWRLFVRIVIVLFIFSPSLLIRLLPAGAQHAHGRGAMSAQDMAKMAAAARANTVSLDSKVDPADQVCARFATGSATTAPPELKSQGGLLEVTFKFLTATDSQGLVRYCYVTNTGLQAPTLRVNPGDQLIIHFQNDLPAASAANAGADMAGMKMALSAPATSNSSACNGAMSASATNIHFHGTNAAPVCGQDEVVHTLIQPGQSFDYNVQIPQNEPPGLYWYHPHPHGFSEGQVQGGATGALIVEGLQNIDPALAGLTERTFVIRDQVPPASEANDTNIPAWDLSINYIPVTYPKYTPAVIRTNPAQQELWRVANTAADTILNLQYVVNGTPQAMRVVAMDGYPIASGSSGQPSESETSILMPPGARAEFVVTTPNSGDQAQLITQNWDTGPDGDFDPTRPIANVVSQDGIESSSASTGVAAKQLPSHAVRTRVTRFAALAAATPIAQRNLAFSEVLQDPTNPNSPTNFFITEEGQQPALFDMNNPPNIAVHSGTVEDWVVKNTALEDHIFHIHQIHFQVLEINGQPVNDAAIRDTVDLPFWSGSGPYPSVKLRMDFRDPNIVGNFVYHCHILQHEDAGMMGAIQVLPSSGLASTTTATASAGSITPNGKITLTASVVDASTESSTPTGTVQFQLNGLNVGSPLTLANGQATLITTVNGDSGANNLTAFYEGDAAYQESLSANIPITISNFALASPGATAAVGSAAIAPVTLNVANNYTTPISLTCAMPASLTQSACFVNPKSISGTGQASLTVNTTPPHPQSSKGNTNALLAAGGGASLACVFLFALPRRRWRGMAMFVLTFMAILFTVIGCGGTAQTDPGTPKGTYTVVVTATASSGSSPDQTSVNVPITIQ
jgi:FtsP/CotA-like multicopper oxidase with cupredoxin domain